MIMYTSHNLKELLFGLIWGITLTTLVACGGKHAINNTTSHNSVPTQVKYSIDNSVYGTLVSKGGTTPIANATVYIPNLMVKKDKKTLRGLSLSNTKIKSTFNKNCKKPSVDYVAFTCTGHDGQFVLKLNKFQSLPIKLSFAKDSRYSNISLSINDLGTDIGLIEFKQIKHFVSKKVAVVVNRLGESKHTSIIASPSQPNTILLSNDTVLLDQYGIDTATSEIEYVLLNSLFLDNDGDSQADINNYATVLLKASWKKHVTFFSAEVKDKLLQYVENGGQLFITEKPVKSDLDTSADIYI